MHKNRKTILLLSVVTFLFPVFAFADTLQTFTPGASNDYFNDGTNNRVQGFQIQADANVTAVSIFATQGNSCSSGTFKIAIFSVDYSDASGVLEAETGVYNCTDLPAYGQSNATQATFDLVTPVDLTANTQYYLKLYGAGYGATVDDIRWIADTSSSYPLGYGYWGSGDTLSPSGTYDFGFGIYGSEAGGGGGSASQTGVIGSVGKLDQALGSLLTNFEELDFAIDTNQLTTKQATKQFNKLLDQFAALEKVANQITAPTAVIGSQGYTVPGGSATSQASPINITVNGAIDAESTARQIVDQIQQSQARGGGAILLPFQ